MNSKLQEFLTKFADNAHLGKITTDLAPGVILTVTILLLLTSFTELRIFPYANRNEHKQRLIEATNKLETLNRQLADSESQVVKCRAELDNLTLSETNKQLKKVDLDVFNKKAEGLRKERDAQQVELKDLASDAKDPQSLKTNLEVLQEHFFLLFVVGFFVGATLAQVSGKLFYNGMFYTYFKA